MLIDISQLEQHDIKLTHKYTSDELKSVEPDVSLDSACTVDITLEKKKKDIRARGTVLTSASMQCDRCLKPVTVELSSNFDLLYLPVENLSKEDEVMLERQELDVAFYKEEGIDLDALTKEQIQLSLPMSNLCKEDCKGLCSECGKNLNEEQCTCSHSKIDPRWSALAKIKSKFE